MELITKKLKESRNHYPRIKTKLPIPPTISPSVFAINLTINQMLSKTLQEIKLTKMDDMKQIKISTYTDQIGSN